MERWLWIGAPCSCRRLVVVAILGCILYQPMNLITRNLKVQTEEEKLANLLAHHPLRLREFDQVEQMILLPPFGLKSADKVNFNDEYLNASSSLARSVFFPQPRLYGQIDPRNDAIADKRLYYSPGKVWLDSDGNPIQAHGGGVVFDEMSERYFWYGENKNGPTYVLQGTGASRVDFIGINCYSSKDLWEWKNEGIVLAREERNEGHDLYRTNVVERPKVIFNERTRKYVMWMHIDDATYSKASVGIAVSNSPTGPFEYLYSKRPNGFDSRDMTVFKDDDGTAYLVYSSAKNKEIHVSPLTIDYLDVTSDTSRVLVGQYREAPAVFKFGGIYYMITSGCSGWAPNEALVHEAESILGPWETIGNPCVGANRVFRAATFFAQGTFVLAMPGDHPGSFMFMADRWNPADLGDSRYLWLPLTVTPTYERFPGLPLWSRVSIFWRSKWRIPFSSHEEMKMSSFQP